MHEVKMHNANRENMVCLICSVVRFLQPDKLVYVNAKLLKSLISQSSDLTAMKIS